MVLSHRLISMTEPSLTSSVPKMFIQALNSKLRVTIVQMLHFECRIDFLLATSVMVRLVCFAILAS